MHYKGKVNYRSALGIIQDRSFLSSHDFHKYILVAACLRLVFRIVLLKAEALCRHFRMSYALPSSFSRVTSSAQMHKKQSNLSFHRKVMVRPVSVSRLVAKYLYSGPVRFPCSRYKYGKVQMRKGRRHSEIFRVSSKRHGIPDPELTFITANVTSISMSSYSWPAETIAGFSNDTPMHIRLFNPEDKDCETCDVHSADFMITGTKTNSSASQLSNSATPSDQDITSSTKDLGLALGLALGLGIPAAVLVATIVTFCCLRSRGREPDIRTADPYEAPLTAWKESPPSTSREVEPPSNGYYGPQKQNTNISSETEGSEINELQPELMRVEVPRDGEILELEGSAMQQHSLSRKFLWQNNGTLNFNANR